MQAVMLCEYLLSASSPFSLSFSLLKRGLVWGVDSLKHATDRFCVIFIVLHSVDCLDVYFSFLGSMFLLLLGHGWTLIRLAPFMVSTRTPHMVILLLFFSFLPLVIPSNASSHSHS